MIKLPSHELQAALAPLRHIGGRHPVLLSAAADTGILSVAAFDAFAGIGARSSVEAEIKSKAEIVVDGGLLGGLVSRIPEHVPAELSVAFGKLKIKAAGSAYKLSQTMPAADFATLPDLDEPLAVIDADAKALHGALAAVCHVARSGEGKGDNVLGCVAFTGDRLMATDGHRLAISVLPEGVKNDAVQLLPAKLCQELLRFTSGGGKVMIQYDTRQARFTIGPAALIGLLGDGRYPNVDRLVPSEFSARATYRRDDLTAALVRAGLVAAQTNGVLVAQIDGNGSCRITAENDAAAGSETLESNDFQGDAVRFAFSAAYMNDAAKNTLGDEIELRVTGPTSPFVVHGCESPSGAVQMIMPVQVREVVK